MPWWRSRHWQFFGWITFLYCFKSRLLPIDLIILFVSIDLLKLGIHRVLERAILSIEYLFELDPAMNSLLLAATPSVRVLILQYNIFHITDWLFDLGLFLTLAVLLDDSIRKFHPIYYEIWCVAYLILCELNSTRELFIS